MKRSYKAWRYILEKVKDFEMKKGAYSFVNPYSMLTLSDFPEVAQNIDTWYVDGISLVKQLNTHNAEALERLSFDDTSLAPVVFSFAREHGLTIAIVGTREDLISIAVANIEKKYSVKVQYFRNGYFQSKSERDEAIEVIRSRKIDLVVCGMGTPYQEKFLIDLKSTGWDGYGFTCGGYLHQIAQRQNYYPRVFDKLNIRWVYRIIDEPKLFKRYAVLYPQFFIRFYFFLMRMKVNRNR